MRSSAREAMAFECQLEEVQPPAQKYVIRHESGAWYNYRIGPHVENIELALTWETRELAEETAQMLTRAAKRGRYEAVPLPTPAEYAS